MSDLSTSDLLWLAVKGYASRTRDGIADWYRYSFDGMYLFMAFMVLLCVLMVGALVFAVIAQSNQREACIADGHQWVKVGEHVVYQNINNVMIPHRVAIMACRPRD